MPGAAAERKRPVCVTSAALVFCDALAAAGSRSGASGARLGFQISGFGFRIEVTPPLRWQSCFERVWALGFTPALRWQEIREGSDAGTPVAGRPPGSPGRDVYHEIAAKVGRKLGIS